MFLTANIPFCPKLEVLVSSETLVSVVVISVLTAVIGRNPIIACYSMKIRIVCDSINLCHARHMAAACCPSVGNEKNCREGVFNSGAVAENEQRTFTLTET